MCWWSQTIFWWIKDAQRQQLQPAVEDVWKFVEANGNQLDAAIDYSRDLEYDYFGSLNDLGWEINPWGVSSDIQGLESAEFGPWLKQPRW